MIDIHGRAVLNRIKGWQDAGVLDADTAARLVAFEAARPSLSLPLLTTVGVLSVALGIVALVSANWDAIPIAIKLGVHIALNLGLATGLWWGIVQEKLGYFGREVVALLLSVSTLALIAHVGQSFQLQGELFNAILFWMVLVTPFTFAVTRSVINRLVWAGGLAAAIGSGFELYAETLLERGLISMTIAGLAVVAYALPLLLHRAGNAALWGRDLHRIALAALVVITATAQFTWEWPFNNSVNYDAVADVTDGAIVAALGFGGAHLLLLWRGAIERTRLAGAMTAFVALSPLLVILPVYVTPFHNAFVAAAAFCLYVGLIAKLAWWNGLVWVYRLAVIAVTCRLLAVFFEAFYGLLATGLGLIITGLILLATGWGLRRLFAHRTLPPQDLTKGVAP